MAARTPARAFALIRVADYGTGDPATKRAQAEEALAIGRELGDDAIVFQALGMLTGTANAQHDFGQARLWLAQLRPVAQKSGDKVHIRIALCIGEESPVSRQKTVNGLCHRRIRQSAIENSKRTRRTKVADEFWQDLEC